MSNHQQWLVNSDFTRDNFKDHVDKLYAHHGYVMFTWSTGRQRTLTQNRALWKFFQLLADTLNDAGMEMEVLIPYGERKGKTITVPWSSDSIKSGIWKPVMKAMTGKESTTELERKECGQIHEVLCARLGESFGVEVPAFPSRDDE